MIDLSISIVLYKNKACEIQKLLNCIVSTSLAFKIYLINNSPEDEFQDLSTHKNTAYIFNNMNLGFGRAHNIALRDSMHHSKYHLVLNPDIKFERGVLEEIFRFMEANKDVGQLMPKVFYENGELQKLCHLLPTPVNLIGRRFFENMRWSKKLNDKYELKGFHYDKCVNIPNLSGCFMFLRCEALKTTGSFDERFFMYMEDVDLTRRMHASYKTLFYPHVCITHGFEKESYNNSQVLRHHINSAIKYFNKWGWLYDNEREKFNRQLLRELNNSKQDCHS